MGACLDLELWVDGRSSTAGTVSVAAGSFITLFALVRNVGDTTVIGQLRVEHDHLVVVDRRTRALPPGDSVSDRVGLMRVGEGVHQVRASVEPLWPTGPPGNPGWAGTEDRTWTGSTGQHRLDDRPWPRLGGATDEAVHQLRPLNRDLIDAVLAAVHDAACRGVPFRVLAEAIVAVAPPSFRWPRRLAWSSPAQLRAVRKVLGAARVDSDADLRAALDEVVRQLWRDGRQRDRQVPSGAGSVAPAPRSAEPGLDGAEDALRTGPEWDPTTGRWWSWWERDAATGDADARSGGTARIVAIHVDGLLAREGNVQHNLFLHTIEDPRIDLDRILGDLAVSPALVDLVDMLTDPERREGVVAAVSGIGPRTDADWSAAYAQVRVVSCWPGATGLDGVLAVISSRGVQVGDGVRHERSSVAVLSPTIEAATLLARNSNLADALVDIVTSGAGWRQLSAFEEVLNGDLVPDVAGDQSGS